MLLRTVVVAAAVLRGAGACTATLSIDIDGVSVKLAFDNTSSVFGTALRHVAELGDAHGSLMGGSCELGDAFCAAGELADGAHALLAERCGDGGVHVRNGSDRSGVVSYQRFEARPHRLDEDGADPRRGAMPQPGVQRVARAVSFVGADL